MIGLILMRIRVGIASRILLLQTHAGTEREL